MADCEVELKIIAIAGPDHQGSGLTFDRDLIHAGAPARGYQVIDFFQGVAGLMASIRSLLDSPRKCLKILEIVAHGQPLAHNDISSRSVATWGRQLMTLAPLGCAQGWAESECAIYLCGCNTGLSHIPHDGDPSIAQSLAEAIPFSATGFRHHIKVYGSKGYLAGTHMNGDEKTDRTYSEGIWPFDTEHPSRKGGADATGGNCWLSYNNW